MLFNFAITDCEKCNCRTCQNIEKQCIQHYISPCVGIVRFRIAVGPCLSVPDSPFLNLSEYKYVYLRIVTVINGCELHENTRKVISRDFPDIMRLDKYAEYELQITTYRETPHTFTHVPIVELFDPLWCECLNCGGKISIGSDKKMCYVCRMGL